MGHPAIREVACVGKTAWCLVGWSANDASYSSGMDRRLMSKLLRGSSSGSVWSGFTIATVTQQSSASLQPADHNEAALDAGMMPGTFDILAVVLKQN